MIKANELRIGNLVNDEDLTPMYIAGLWPVDNGKQYNWIDSAGNTGNVNLLSGIALTPDLLGKWGFEKDYNPEKDHRVEFWNNNACRLEVYDAKIKSVHGAYIKHLHQLQNLYYALTGEELNNQL